eukprot:g4051.t1
MDMHPVRVPKELEAVRATVLEEYVRNRLNQFSIALERKLAPGLAPEVFERITNETYSELPPPEYCNRPIEAREFQLVFRHDCTALGCNDQNCALCQHSSVRRCRLNFDRKYLVGDSLHAKCNQPIRIELVDTSTGRVFTDDIGRLEVAMCILDGNKYDTLQSDNDVTGQDWDALQECCLFVNKKNHPLLQSTAGGANLSDGRVVTRLEKGKAILPEIHVTDSSEALLSGRKPPFRLLAWVQEKDNYNITVKRAVSEGFVVATRRTRTAGKADIPKVDDTISRLEHMGKETVKKLQDISAAACSASITIVLPDGIPNSILKVGEFRRLVQAADQDGTLRQKLQQVLKLSKEKWDEAREHAYKCVVPDNRMRAWYSDRYNHEVGLLFTCRMGIIDMDRPVALLKWRGSNEQQNIEATLMVQLTPQQREEVRIFQSQAYQCWWKTAHPGWSLSSYDSEEFLATGNFVHVGNLPGVLATSPESSPPSSAKVGGRSAMEESYLGVIDMDPVVVEMGSVMYSGQHNTSEPYHSMNNHDNVNFSHLGQDLPTPELIPRHPVQNYEGIPAGVDPFHGSSAAGDQKSLAGQFYNETNVPDSQALPSGYSMNYVFPELEALGRTNSYEHGHQGALNIEPHAPLFYGGNGVHPAKVESLELPEVPDILLRDLSGTYENLRGARLGRDESLGLESMQSIEQSLEEVEREQRNGISVQMDHEGKHN